jgi:hypothetical protein
MKILNDGDTAEMKGSGKKPYLLRNVGGVYDRSCPAWRNQSHAIDARTCKHLCKYLGNDAELARVGFDNLPTAIKKKLGKASATSRCLSTLTWARASFPLADQSTA